MSSSSPFPSHSPSSSVKPANVVEFNNEYLGAMARDYLSSNKGKKLVQNLCYDHPHLAAVDLINTVMQDHIIADLTKTIRKSLLLQTMVKLAVKHHIIEELEKTEEGKPSNSANINSDYSEEDEPVKKYVHRREKD